MQDPLSRLAILYGTDKFGYHDYTPNYHQMLQGWRDRPLRMLEIGVGGYGGEDRGGESLEVWRDYFAKAQITGIDIQKKTMDLGPRVQILQGSQVDAEFLSGTVADRGPFHIILDDGSHRNEHVVESFGLLFPTLEPGGIYIIEDVQTAFFPRFGGSLALADPNSVGMVGRLLLALPENGAGDVVAIERFHNILALHKRDPDRPAPGLAGHRALAAGADRAEPRVVAGQQAADADILSRAIDEAGPGGTVVIEGWPGDRGLIHDMFVQIDHREIAVHFPDAPIRDIAKKVLSLAAYPDGLVLEIGDNDYPSNFGFDQTHPRVVAAKEVMADVLRASEARPNGLLQYARMLQQVHGHEATYDILDRLSAEGCTERRYFQMAVVRAKRRHDWNDLVGLCQKALAQFPDNPEFLADLGHGMDRLGKLDEALGMLRDAYRNNPRGRALVLGLARLEHRAGQHDTAIRLYDRSINMFPKLARAGRLRQLAQMCKRMDRPEDVAHACRRWLELEPDSVEAADMLATLG